MTTNVWGALSRAALTTLALCGCLSNDEQLIAPLSAPSGPVPSDGAPAPDPALLDEPDPAVQVGDDPSLDVGATGGELGAEPLPESFLAGPTTPAPSGSAESEAEASTAAMEAPPEPCSTPGLLLCEDFEALSAGQFPVGDAWLPELAGCSSHRIDASGVSASGRNALRADASSYPECMLHADLTGESELYVRSWVLLGDDTSSTQQYISLLEFGPRAGQDEPELRVGVRSSTDSLCVGRPGLDVSVGGVVGGPSTECSGVLLEQDRWYCLQAHFKRSGRGLDFSVQVDGAPAATRSYPALDAAWNGDELYFKLGRAAYGGQPRGSVWHDDVAIGDQPIACDPLP